MDEEEAIQNIFEILQDFHPTDIVYLFGDLCTMQGWRVSISIGDSDRIGDLSVTRVIPYPETVEVIYFDGDELSEDQLREWTTDFEHSSRRKLTVVSWGAPTTEALEYADQRGIGIIGVADLAEEIYELSIEDLLADIVAQDEALLEAHESRLSELGCQFPREAEVQDGSTTEQEDRSHSEIEGEESSDETGYAFQKGVKGPEVDDSSVHGGNEFMTVEYLGHEPLYIKGTRQGLLVALVLGAKEFDLKLDGDHFTLYDTNQITYECVDKYDSEFVESLHETIESPWRLYETEVGAGGKVKYLLYFPCDDSVSIEKMRFRSRLFDLFPMTHEQIRSTVGIDSQSETAFDIALPSDARPSTEGLPSDLLEQLEGLGATRNEDGDSPSDTDDSTGDQDTVSLQSESVDGAERTDNSPAECAAEGANDRMSIKLTGIDYYEGTGEHDLGEFQDGLFVSLEIASLGPDIQFKSHDVTVVDSEGYAHQAENRSEAFREIELSGLLTTPWQFQHDGGGSNMTGDVPSGGKIKSLVHIPSTGAIEINEFKYQGREGDEIIIELSADNREKLQGLPDLADEALRKIDYVQ